VFLLKKWNTQTEHARRRIEFLTKNKTNKTTEQPTDRFFFEKSEKEKVKKEKNWSKF
jgi:hypothetical protein